MAVKLEAQVEKIGKIYFIEAPFDKALKALKRRGAKIISARDLAYSKIKTGPKSSLSQNGSYIKEGDIYIPEQEGVILVRDSLVLESSKKATQAHREGKEFFIDKEQGFKYLEKAKDSKDDSAILITDFTSIPTNRFGEDKRTNWLFKDQAKDYGLFLKDNGIEKMPLHFNEQSYINKQEKPYANQLWLYFDNQNYINKQEKPYANQLWLSDLSNRSGLYGLSVSLDCGNSVRGVLKETSEVSSQKRLYTNRQVNNIIKIISGVREGKLPASKLEKALDFFENLKE